MTLKIEVENRPNVGKFIRTYVRDRDYEKVQVVLYIVPKKERSKWPYKWCIETYKGENYIVGSKARSYSRMYPEGKGLPKKYTHVVKELKAKAGI